MTSAPALFVQSLSHLKSLDSLLSISVSYPVVILVGFREVKRRPVDEHTHVLSSLAVYTPERFDQQGIYLARVFRFISDFQTCRRCFWLCGAADAAADYTIYSTRICMYLCTRNRHRYTLLLLWLPTAIVDEIRLYPGIYLVDDTNLSQSLRYPEI